VIAEVAGEIEQAHGRGGHDKGRPCPVSRKRKLTAAYHVCASSVMIPAPDEIGLMSISW